MRSVDFNYSVSNTKGIKDLERRVGDLEAQNAALRDAIYGLAAAAGFDHIGHDLKSALEPKE